MSSSELITIVITVCLVGFILYRQMGQRQVTQRRLLMPVLLGVVLGGIFVSSNPAGEAVAAAAVGVAFGVLSGLVSGQFLRVWRDERTGQIYQKGSWRYLLVVLALVVIRFAVRFALQAAGHAIDETALNDALIAAIVSNYLGRAIRIAQRALLLVGGNFSNLSARS